MNLWYEEVDVIPETDDEYEYYEIEEEPGRIALCTLGSINWGAFSNPLQMKKACRVLVRSLSNILSYQDFVSVHSKLSTLDYEPIGIGITNLAYWHAKRNFKYGEENSLAEVKKWIEAQAFFVNEMSVDLAQERGPCKKSHTTWYHKGVFPWERRADGVNELTDFTPNPQLDWEGLRVKMMKYGVRNAVQLNCPPVESSSVCINSTNGIELPMELISVKESKGSSLVQVVPEYKKLKNKYQLLWKQKDCINYLKVNAVLAAYVDQAISTNTFYSPKYFEGGKIPATLIAKNMMLATKWGIKTFYYNIMEKAGSKKSIETKTSSTNIIANDDTDESCESCKL